MPPGAGPAGTVDYEELVSRGQVNAMASFCRLSVTLRTVIIARRLDVAK
jgi:hypothetical protein